MIDVASSEEQLPVGTYRREAARAFAAAISVAGLFLALSSVTIWVGSAGLRLLAATLAHACQRLWAVVPPALQVGLLASVAGGLLATGFWAGTMIRQWRRTEAAASSVARCAVALPSHLSRLLDKHALADRVILIDDRRPTAFSIGLATPRIVLSTGLLDLLDEDELEAVLLHEQSHVRHWDPAGLLVTRTLGTVFFFIPMCQALARRHQAAVELAADDDVIAAQGQTLSLASAVGKLLRPNALAGAGAFMAGADLRLSRLLGEQVMLPGIPRRLKAGSGMALALMSLPVVAVYGLAETLTLLPFLLRCTL